MEVTMPEEKLDRVGWPLNTWRKEAGGFSRGFTYQLVNQGKIETAKVGGRRIILTPPRDFLRRHLETRGVKPLSQI
jgi:hypothetical protein